MTDPRAQRSAMAEAMAALLDGPKRPDMTGRYTTLLPSQQEMHFARVYPDPKESFDYDMRGAFQAGARPGANGHYTDQFKKPNHATFSAESQYNGQDGYQGGQWVPLQNGQWAFQATDTNVANMGAPGLQEYFARVEPGNELRLPGKKPR